MCQLRYNWGQCTDNLQWFYGTIFASYSVTLIVYVILTARLIHQRKQLASLKFRMMWSVIVYSLFGALHAASNLTPIALFSELFTEYALTICFLFMMLAILFLITSWVYMSRIITGKLGITKSVFKKNFENIFVSSIIVVTGVCALITDTLMVYVPEYSDIFVTINLALWGIATLTVGILIAIYGGKVLRYIAEHRDMQTYQKAYNKIRLLYLGYSILAFFYAFIYCAAIIVTIWFYSQTAWLIVYGLFHLVIILTAYILLLIFYKKVMTLDLVTGHSSGKVETGEIVSAPTSTRTTSSKFSSPRDAIFPPSDTLN